MKSTVKFHSFFKPGAYMRKTEFYVKPERMADVAMILGKYSIINQIRGITVDKEVILVVNHLPGKKKGIFELQCICDYYEIPPSELGLDNIETFN